MFKKILLGAFGAIVIGVGVAGYIRIRPATTKIDPITYFGEFSPEYTNMTFEDARIDLFEPAIIKNGKIFVSSEFANKYVDDTVFYDPREDILTVTTLNDVARYNIDEENEDFLFEQNEICYILDTFLEERFPIDFVLGEDGRVVIAKDLSTEKQLGKITKRTGAAVRTHADKKRFILDEAIYKSEVEIYGELLDYYRIRDENGFIGYVKKRYIELTGVSETKDKKVYEPHKVDLLDEKVRLAWDQMTVLAVNNFDHPRYNNIQDLNVLAPTWFDFKDENGNLNSRASHGYIKAAKAEGIEVWALLSHNFSNPEFTSKILNSTTKRQRVIDQLVEYSLEYNLDGINIDIENVTQSTSEEWVQFMRELYPQLGEIGVCVSVDVYIPSEWSKFYMRDKIAQVVDYFIVMAYDEHWSGSDIAGPVASIGWVEEGLKLNLDEVPNDKLVLGIPFFNRIWAENGDVLETRAISMYEANSRIKNAGAKPTYDDLTKLNYAEFEQDNKLYKIWLEDKDAISKRIDLIEKYDLAGYAAWKLGLETSDVWAELSKMSK